MATKLSPGSTCPNLCFLPGTVGDPKLDIVQPAVEGTKTVLQAAAKHKDSGLKRVVVTSSVCGEQQVVAAPERGRLLLFALPPVQIALCAGMTPAVNAPNDEPGQAEPADPPGRTCQDGRWVMQQRSVHQSLQASTGHLDRPVFLTNTPFFLPPGCICSHP